MLMTAREMPPSLCVTARRTILRITLRQTVGMLITKSNSTGHRQATALPHTVTEPLAAKNCQAAGSRSHEHLGFRACSLVSIRLNMLYRLRRTSSNARLNDNKIKVLDQLAYALTLRDLYADHVQASPLVLDWVEDEDFTFQDSRMFRPFSRLLDIFR